jgi:uncharacterized protein (TIGR04255 family)
VSRLYQKPPLIEALCEFQFADADSEWDWTIPGLVYQQIKEQFPIKRHAPTVEFEVQAEPDQVSQRLKGGLGRMQFLRTDKTALVQVGPQLLAVNQLRPYPHWSRFKPLILDTLEIYRQVARPAGFKRIGLRYVNQIQLPSDEVELSTYFNFGPRLPAPIASDPIRSLLLRVDLGQASHRGHLILTLASAPREDQGDPTLILDLDFATTSAANVTLDGIDDWIEQAHDRIETAFEASITDRLRARFEEVRP